MGRKLIMRRKIKKSPTSIPPPPPLSTEEEEEEEEEEQQQKSRSPNPEPTSPTPVRKSQRSRSSIPSQAPNPNPNPNPASPTVARKSKRSRTPTQSQPPNPNPTSPTMARKSKRSRTSTPPPLHHSPEEEEEDSESRSEHEAEPAKPVEEKAPIISTQTPNPNSSRTTKGQFERKWSYEDEIVLLKALAAYNHSQKRRMSVILSEVRIFLSTLSPSFSMEFSDAQVTNKLRHIHDSHKSLSSRCSKPDFKTPHSEAIFGLCQQIWGGGANPDVEADDVQIISVSNKKKTKKSENKMEKKTEKQHDPCYPRLMEALEKMDTRITADEISKMFRHAKAATFGNEFRKVDTEIMKYERSKFGLFKESLDMVMEAMGI